MIFQILKYVAVLIFVAASTSTLAITLKKSIGYLEENVFHTRTVLNRFFYTILLQHVAFVQTSFKLGVLSILAQALYLGMLHKYPKISCKEQNLILGLIFTFICHINLTYSIPSMPLSSFRIIHLYFILWITPIAMCILIAAADGLVFFDVSAALAPAHT